MREGSRGAVSAQLTLPLVLGPDLGRRSSSRARRRSVSRADRPCQSALPFPPELSAPEPDLGERLGARLGERVAVRLTDNRRTMISTSRAAGRLTVRLHGMFGAAPPAVLDAVAAWIARRDRRASAAIDRFVEANRAALAAARGRPAACRPRGEHHDLEAIANELADRYFGGRREVRITWGRRAGRRRRRSIRLGSYSFEERLIRIHPALDRERVPRYVVAWVVYHELLHHELGTPRVGGRRQVHGAEFRRREQLYPDHDRARAWEARHLGGLLRG